MIPLLWGLAAIELIQLAFVVALALRVTRVLDIVEQSNAIKVNRPVYPRSSRAVTVPRETGRYRK